MTQQEALEQLDRMVLAETGGVGVWCTPEITRAVIAWCVWMGAGHVDREWPCPYVRTLRDGTTAPVDGRVDIVATWRSGRRLAIEIDSKHAEKSARKLAVLKERGFHVLWLRWSIHNDVSGVAPEGITTHWTRIADPRPRRRRRAVLASLKGP